MREYGKRMRLAAAASALLNILFLAALTLVPSPGDSRAGRERHFPRLAVALQPAATHTVVPAPVPASQPDSQDAASQQPLQTARTAEAAPAGKQLSPQPVAAEAAPTDSVLSEAAAEKETGGDQESSVSEKDATAPHPALPGGGTPGAPDATAAKGSDPRAEFLVRLQKMIAENQNYPRRARQRGTEGTVVLSLSVDTDGNLASCSVETSSGSSTLDRAARSLLKRIFPVADPPAQKIFCTVAVAYRLN